MKRSSGWLPIFFSIYIFFCGTVSALAEEQRPAGSSAPKQETQDSPKESFPEIPSNIDEIIERNRKDWNDPDYWQKEADRLQKEADALEAQAKELEEIYGPQDGVESGVGFGLVLTEEEKKKAEEEKKEKEEKRNQGMGGINKAGKDWKDAKEKWQELMDEENPDPEAVAKAQQAIREAKEAFERERQKYGAKQKEATQTKDKAADARQEANNAAAKAKAEQDNKPKNPS